MLAAPCGAQVLEGGAADSTQSSPPATPPKSRKVYYADVWTPRDRTGEINLHGGVFAPVHKNSSGVSPTLGLRLGLDLGSHVMLGVMGDWVYKSKSLLEPIPSELPNLEPQIVLAKVDAQIIPAMMFLQVKLTDQFPLVPYVGVAAGYEWLMLNANDYRTDESAHVTYADWAWQSFAGLGLRLSRGVRLDSELFYNGGMLERDVHDQFGETVSEVVDVNGVGARIGLNIVY
jgi:hypothetical protein